MNSHREPVAEHATCAPRGPLCRIGRPAEQPMLEEEVEVLHDKRLDFIHGVEVWAEKDCELVACY